jgi:chemotaxis methyl-accepting protein methylase
VTGGFEVRESLRSAVQWRTSDVTQVHEPGAWDLILCRNMAMYLRSCAAAQLWRAMEASLRPGGFLVLGKAERPAGAKRLSAIAPCIYRRDRG